MINRNISGKNFGKNINRQGRKTNGTVNDLFKKIILKWFFLKKNFLFVPTFMSKILKLIFKHRRSDVYQPFTTIPIFKK